MRLGLSRASYRWFVPPDRRYDFHEYGLGPQYGFRGMAYPYGTTAEPPGGDLLGWYIDRCHEWGLDSLNVHLLEDGDAAAQGKRLADAGIEWIGGLDGAWALDADEWPAMRDQVLQRLEEFGAGGVRIASLVNSDPPGPPGQPMPNGGLRFGHFSREVPMPEQIDRMVRNLPDIVRQAETYGIVLCFENHMDYRISEIVQVVEAVDSPSLKVNYDFANSYSVAEDQVDAAHLAAPYTVMTHLKDMRVQSITTTGEPQFFHAPVGYGSVEIAEILGILQRGAPDPDNIAHCIETPTLPQYDPQLWMKLTIDWLTENASDYFPSLAAGATA